MTHLLLGLLAFRSRRGDNPVAVAPFQQSNARRTRGRLVLVVEQHVLVEHEVPQLPFAHVGAAFIQVSTNSVLHLGFVGQVEQLGLADANILLHDAVQCLDTAWASACVIWRDLPGGPLAG